MQDMNYFKDLLARLIGVCTVSSEDQTADRSNLELLNILENEAESMNGICTRQNVLSSPRKDNMLIRFGPDVPGGLLLSGHTDTVPYDEHGWNSDPFTLTEDNDFFYGLGVIDMKGFFAHALAAFREIRETAPLLKPLYLLATVNEETTMAGAIEFARCASVKPDAVIIGEPTSLTPIFKHKGYMAYRIEVTGRSCHSSNPAEGINAISIMNRIISGIEQLTGILKNKYQDHGFPVNHPTLNIGSVHGGDAPNRICGSCVLELDIRPTPATSPEMLDKLLRETVMNAVSAAGYDQKLISIQELYSAIPPFETDPGSELIGYCEKITGKNRAAVNYSTEASFLSALGAPLVVLGAGNIADAHQVNEKLPKKDAEEINRFLREIIKQYCMKD